MNPAFKFQSRTQACLFEDTCQSHAGHIGVHQLIEEAQLDQSLGTRHCHLYCKGEKVQMYHYLDVAPLLPEGTDVSFIVHLLDLHQVSNGEQVVI